MGRKPGRGSAGCRRTSACPRLRQVRFPEDGETGSPALGQSNDRARENDAPERRPGAEASARGATMKVDVSAKPLIEASGDALVLDCYAGDDRTGSEMRRVDVTLGGVLALALRDLRFEGRVAEVADVHTGGRFPAKRILVVGLGPRAEC